MLQYNGKPLKLCSYTDLELKEHHWVDQIRADNYGHTIQIWWTKDGYCATIV